VPTDIVSAFTDSLADLEVGWSRVPPAECAEAVAAAVEGPAVGVPLSDADASLPAVVETEPTVGDLDAARTGVTGADFGVAAYGSVFLPDDPDGVEPVSLFVDRHVAVLRESDLFDDLPESVDHLGPRLRDGESGIVATGPSATADMGALVKGAHGPKEVHVILLADDGNATDDGVEDPTGVTGP